MLYIATSLPFFCVFHTFEPDLSLPFVRCAVCAYSSCINSCCPCAKSIWAQSGNWSTEGRSKKEKTPQLKPSDERGGKQWEVKKMRGQKVYELKTRDKERETREASWCLCQLRLRGTEWVEQKRSQWKSIQMLPSYFINFLFSSLIFFKVQLFSQSH